MLTPTNAPNDCEEVAGSLGWLLAEQNDWQGAATAFLTAVRAADVVYQSRKTAESRMAQLGQAPTLPRWAAYALVRAGRVEQAVEVLENARARESGEVVARDEADLSRLRSVDRVAYGQFLQARTALQQVERSSDTSALSASGPGPGSEHVALHFMQVVAQIREIPGFERFLAGPGIAEIATIAVGGPPIVYLLASPHGSTALMVTGEGADAQGTPAEPDQPGDGARVRAVDGNGITSKDIIELLMMPMNSLHPRPGVLLAQQGPPALLEAALDRALLAVGQALLFPLAQALRDRKATQVVLIPCGPMGLLPLQAAWWREEGVVRHFLDEVTVSYAPSAVIYRAARERARRLAGRSPVLVGLGNPLPSPLQLPAAQAELASIGQVFAGEQLDLACGAGATKDFLLAHLDGATHLHLACHGKGSFGDPLDSALLLGADQLTLREITTSVRVDARLVVLSACQSGHFDILTAPDEVVGLPTGLLRAGAAAIVAALWPVEDEVTALFMTRFYELLRHRPDGPGAPAFALRAAQIWLRTLSRADEDAYLAARPQLERTLRHAAARSPGRHLLTEVIPRIRRWHRRHLSPTPYGHPSDWAAFHLVGV